MILHYLSLSHVFILVVTNIEQQMKYLHAQQQTFVKKELDYDEGGYLQARLKKIIVMLNQDVLTNY